MARPAGQSQQPSQARRAAGSAAVASAAQAVTSPPTPDPGALATPVTASVVLAGVLASFVAWLGGLREQHRATLARELGRYSPQPQDIAAAIRDEMRLEDLFAKRAADRLAASLPDALAIADSAQRERRVRQLLADEQRFAAQRGEAMFARALAALQRMGLRRESPLGAFWRLGPAQKHTAGCEFMSGHDRGLAGRFWPWAVLDRVHPPRHFGCTARLHGYGEAVLSGWMTPSDVPDTRQAVRDAMGVVMESADAEAVLTELDVRARLLELGVDTAAIPFVGIIEAFDGGRHPRDWKGRFRTVGDVAETMAARSIAWRIRERGSMPADAPSAEQIQKNWARQLRGSLSHDRAAIASVAAANAENAKNELYQRIVAAHEPDHVVVTKPRPERTQSLMWSGHGTPHRVAGTTAIPDEAVRTIEQGAIKSPADHPASSAGYGLAAVLRHEYGHSIDDLLPRDVRRHVLDAIPNPSEDLTYYTSVGDQEVIPELLALITHPDYRASDWPQTVQEAERRLLAALGQKRLAEQGVDTSLIPYEGLALSEEEDGRGAAPEVPVAARAARGVARGEQARGPVV